MDLSGLVLAAVDARGYRQVLGYREDTAPPDTNLLRLVPGVRLERQKLLVPCNLTREAKPWIVKPGQTTPSGLPLRGYQLEAIQFIEECPVGCLLCLDVGLGKGAITLEWLRNHPELRPFIVVGPLIASGAWVGENADPAKHFGMTIVALRTRMPSDELAAAPEINQNDTNLVSPGVDGYFINYQILAGWTRQKNGVKETHPGWLPWLQMKVAAKVIVVDESHEIRNYRVSYAKAVHKLCIAKSVQKRIFLSATPVVNKIFDLYHQLECVQPGLWGHSVPFNENILTSWGQRYCAASHNGHGWFLDGESNSVELRARLANVMIRRSRFDVRKELPPFERQCVQVPHELLDQESYKQYQSIASLTIDAWKAAQGVLQGAELQRSTGMFNYLSWAKRDVAAKQAENLARSTENRKLLVYCWHKRTAKYIVTMLKRRCLHTFGPITGETLLPKRMREAEAFRDLKLAPDGAAVCVATLKAAGQSLNPLSAASAVLFVDLYWVPQVLLQAEGRVHREGQTASSVLALYLTVKGSVDELMFRHLEKKAKFIANATGDKAATSLVEVLGGHSEEESLKNLVKELSGLSEADMRLS